MPDLPLQLNELFHSIQGESTLAGLPTIFVRFQGCNLRCGYCDTPGAQEAGPGRSIDAWRLLEVILGHGCSHVCLTGGEPLIQRQAVAFLAQKLMETGRTVSLETNGSLPLAGLPDRLIRVVDLKTPGSGMAEHNLDKNLGQLGVGDQLKCVVAHRADFDWAVDRVRRADLPEKGVPVLFSPVQGRLDPASLAAWIMESGLPLRLQLQLHRLVWPREPEGTPIRLPK